MSVTNKNFSLSLLDENNEYISCVDGNFFLKHGTEYKILITNQSDYKANANIYVDGKEVGLFRIEAKPKGQAQKQNNEIIIERSADNQKARKLTFYNISSKEAKMGKIDGNNRDIGKLQVKIQKEAKLKQDRKIAFASRTETDSMDNRHIDETDSCVRENIGGTALGRPSNQCFSQADYIETDNDIIVLEAMMLLMKERIISL